MAIRTAMYWSSGPGSHRGGRGSRGVRAGSIHLRYLNPLPPDLDDVFGKFEHLLVPELNNGQLVRVLRDRYLLPFVAYNKIQGRPFGPIELADRIVEQAG